MTLKPPFERFSVVPARAGLYDPRNERDACGLAMVATLRGTAGHDIITTALTALRNLEHRGAVGSDEGTGDGAGIITQLPDTFLRAVADFELPPVGRYVVGMAFLPKDAEERDLVKSGIAQIAQSEELTVLGWREVPVRPDVIGSLAREAMPVFEQLFLVSSRTDERGPVGGMPLERQAFRLRKRAERELHAYFPSLSSRTLVYKGMVTTLQLEPFYPDLSDERFASKLALVHSRYSTNTFPSWPLAQPFRTIAHNGEINTIQGNRNWMRARQSQLENDALGDLKPLLPINTPGASDSASFDEVVELLNLGGRSLPHAMMMMVPEPWAAHESMSEEKKAFYKYHSCLMEPWDGPAAIAFTDGTIMGAVLDRNGLRPSRYYVTKDDLVIMASEAGVLPIAPERIAFKGRLQPGRMFLVDMAQGRIIADEEIKQQVATEHPYGEWLKQHMVALSTLKDAPEPTEIPFTAPLLQRQTAFGYTFEDLRLLLPPMARDGVEAIGAMGADTPLAVLSDRPKLLYDYFQQLFAQVTNPPIDSIREEIVTSAETTIGSERNLLKPEPESCRLIELKTPILSNQELGKLQQIDQAGFKSVTLPILFNPKAGVVGLEQAIQEMTAAADQAIATGANILILSDRAIDLDHAPIPALLAVAALHHHLIRAGTRTRVGLVLESGEPREVHHYATLIGYGCGAINPYLAFETIADMIQERLLVNVDYPTACKNYIKAATKGVVKVASKIGISTIQSYRGAQIFEAIGLNQSVIDRYFTWTASRIEGADLNVIAQEAIARHHHAFPDREVNGHTLDVGGEYQWRKEGEAHLFSPQVIHTLQQAVRQGNYDLYKQYAALVNEQNQKHFTLRGLLAFKPRQPVPIDEVEPMEAIVKRFKTGAMSYGSISQEAHEALAIAMNRIGGKSNTGEGGEDRDRYTWTNDQGDSKNSAIKQVASGRFGVTSLYLSQARELQIKMAQGAKPGEGGQLPGKKVYPWIAKVRHSTPGVGLISPPPHHDIYSIEDLAQLIHDLKNCNSSASISVKLVSEVGVGTVAAGVAKAKADHVTIAGHDGGTGASPISSIKHAGTPWELGLAETQQTLVLNRLRGRIAVQVDGQMKTGRDVLIGALLGADEFGFATAPLVVQGCIMMRKCHLNTCPVGVATQDPILRKKFTGQPEHVVNFFFFIAEEVRELMAAMGVRKFEDLIGRADLLETRKGVAHWKAKGLDFSRIFHVPDMPKEVARHHCEIQDHGLSEALDHKLIAEAKPALESKQKVHIETTIRNLNRTAGAMLSGEVAKRYGHAGLPEDTINIKLGGTAGQSFAAFLARGVTMELTGQANDYVGKGLSGGRVIVKPHPDFKGNPLENIIVGNTVMYGAIAGEAYFRGVAGERFCVRNSGASAVVEGTGDHGCEYMTGGTVAVLGATGRNFGAGMSGGVAYVLDDEGLFKDRCNTAMVELEALSDAITPASHLGMSDTVLLKSLIENHAKYTGSQRALDILGNWPKWSRLFVKVMPTEYRRALTNMAATKAVASASTKQKAA